MRRTLTGALAAALLGAAWLIAQSTVNGPQPAPGTVAVGKGAAFQLHRTAVINASGFIDGVTDPADLDCVLVNGTGAPCAASGLVSSIFGRQGTVTATLGDYSFGLISGSATAGQLPGLSALNGSLNLSQIAQSGASVGQCQVWSDGGWVPALCLIQGAGFASSRTAVINSLGKIDAAAGSPSDCMHVDGSSGTCGTNMGGANFADDESPTQVDALDYTLVHTPSPSSSLQLFLNGVKLEGGGIDYTLSTNTITFTSYWGGLLADPLVAGTVLVASYRY